MLSPVMVIVVAIAAVFILGSLPVLGIYFLCELMNERSRKRARKASAIRNAVAKRAGKLERRPPSEEPDAQLFSPDDDMDVRNDDEASGLRVA